jgi:hypothetical protein
MGNDRSWRLPKEGPRFRGNAIIIRHGFRVVSSVKGRLLVS